MDIETERLTLVPAAPRYLVALIDDPDSFERISGLRAADGLRGFFASEEVSPGWVEGLRVASAPDPWRHGFFVVHHGTGTAIGSAGFTGPPDPEGVVEIAYGIVPDFEGQGLATEVALALVRFASANGQVRLLRAHTLPAANASTRVLAKCGFRHIGSVVDPADGPVWRWERDPDRPPR